MRNGAGQHHSRLRGADAPLLECPKGLRVLGAAVLAWMVVMLGGCTATLPTVSGARETASVTVGFTVGADGTPQDIRVVASRTPKELRNGMESAAMEVVAKKWRFKLRQAGERMEVPIVFTLDETPGEKNDVRYELREK